MKRALSATILVDVATQAERDGILITGTYDPQELAGVLSRKLSSLPVSKPDVIVSVLRKTIIEYVSCKSTNHVITSDVTGMKLFGGANK